jgi:magnesium chelatase family protein
VEKYLSKISGPLLDRIDLHLEVPAVPFTQLAEMPPGPTSAELRAQVLEARARQSKRFGPRGPQVNGRMTPRPVQTFCALKPEALAILKAALEDLG